MRTSTHYNLKLAEGTDIVNPLTVDVPNYEAIDGQMYDNEIAGVDTATESKTGTNHALTRSDTNRNIFKFRATSVFNEGDTFTVDGTTVTALYPNQSTLTDRCFIVGSEVLCMLNGTQLTVMASFIPKANEIPYNNAGVTVKDAIDSKITGNVLRMEQINFDTNTDTVLLQISGIYDSDTNTYVRLDFRDTGITLRKYQGDTVLVNKSIAWD